jgi:2,3-bisphosphoglycerate-independent phosphoglycerate mutase
MVTHDLVQRGVPFDAAYAIARALRDELAERGEVSTAELKGRIGERLARDYSHLPAAGAATTGTPRLEVTYGGQSQPFSRGLLAQSLHAAGLQHDRAYRLALDIQQELLEGGARRLESQELARHAGELLERWEGATVAGRYRLLRRIGGLARPVVVYLGGATGTGKSTLAVDLAPLLRIYRINSTDTIREVVRLGVTPAMLPSLHRSSFELDEDIGLPVGQGEAETPDCLVRAFEEQAVRVCVAVRAVVERAIAENTSILVEGVHLAPPWVPFADLEGAAYQVSILLLTSDEEVHRSHLLARARRSGRRAERYLERFAAIRNLQELLLQRAEEHEVPLLDTTDRERTAQNAVRLVTGVLQQRLPSLAAPDSTPVRLPPSVLLVIDGMADHPLESLGGRTPLEAASTPNLNRLAREGRVGLADPIAPGVVPDTASGMLAIFGQPPRAMKRGAIEALGVKLVLPPSSVALRGNFATLDEKGLVLDRRAGRIREGAEELAAALDRLPLSLHSPVAEGIEVLVRPGTEHRLAIALVGPGLSSAIAGSDPGDAAIPAAVLTPRALSADDLSASRTAGVLALFEQQARQVLADHAVNAQRRRAGAPLANCVLTRAPGRIHRLLPPEPSGRTLRIACVSGDCTVLGIARAVGGRALLAAHWTANLDTDLAAKFEAAAEALATHDLVVLHVKGADVAAHDHRPDLKVAFLEALDRELGHFLARVQPTRLAVASDHTTYSDSGQHGADPVPVLLWGEGIEPDAIDRFDERTASGGSLKRFALQSFIDRLYETGDA